MKNLSNELRQVLSELETLAVSYTKPSGTPGHEGVWLPEDNTIRMWSVPRSTGEYLYEQILKYRPEIILELGTSSGYSALWMAAAARTYGGHVYSIELAPAKISIAKQYIARAGFSDHITILEGYIDTVLDDWKKAADFVFLDADKHNYLNYIKKIEPFLAEGSVVIADNAVDFADLMQDYTAYMKNSSAFKTTLLEKDNGLLVSKKV